jgi:hypothetical protein
MQSQKAVLLGLLLFALLTLATISAIIIRQQNDQEHAREPTALTKVEIYVCAKALPYIYSDKPLEESGIRLTVNVVSTIETNGSLVRALCVRPEDK